MRRTNIPSRRKFSRFSRINRAGRFSRFSKIGARRFTQSGTYIIRSIIKEDPEDWGHDEEATCYLGNTGDGLELLAVSYGGDDATIETYWAYEDDKHENDSHDYILNKAFTKATAKQLMQEFLDENING